MAPDTGLTFSTAGATATGRETDDGFVVLAGSTARRTPTGTIPAGYQALRDQVVSDGKLIAGPAPELYAFYEFGIPFSNSDDSIAHRVDGGCWHGEGLTPSWIGRLEVRYTDFGKESYDLGIAGMMLKPTGIRPQSTSVKATSSDPSDGNHS